MYTLPKDAVHRIHRDSEKYSAWHRALAVRARAVRLLEIRTTIIVLIAYLMVSRVSLKPYRTALGQDDAFDGAPSRWSLSRLGMCQASRCQARNGRPGPPPAQVTG